MEKLKAACYTYENGKLEACKYIQHGICNHPSKMGFILTSTLPGAHPNNCPIIKKEGKA